MSVFGIVCEFNPIHRGHQFLMETARRLGAEAVVCVMSGNATQRGELAVANAYLRAEAAVRAGADLVLELPFPWCASSAEGFARGGIAVLRHFADTVLFGSECGDLATLTHAATVASTPAFREAYQAALANGDGAARAYGACLTQHGVPPLASNDLLGVAYLRAARELNAALTFQTIPRTGAAYTDDTLPTDTYPSALAIRRLWSEGRFEETVHALPPQCVELFRQAMARGEITSERELDAVWLSYFRLHEGDDFRHCVGAEGGLAHRICAAARQARSAEELLDAVKTKRYTDAHLRRTMLHCLAHTPPEAEKTLPAYTTLLAANEIGRALLAKARRESELPVVTKPADAPRDTVQYRATERVDHVFSLATPTKHSASLMLTQAPYVQ